MQGGENEMTEASVGVGVIAPDELLWRRPGAATGLPWKSCFGGIIRWPTAWPTGCLATSKMPSTPRRTAWSKP